MAFSHWLVTVGSGFTRRADGGQITMEDLQVVEHVVRLDPKVIEQCEISGIPKEDMHKVYCDRSWCLCSNILSSS